jgi:hypothetical protein
VVIHAEWWAPQETVTIASYCGAYDRKRIAAAGYRMQADASRPQQAGVEMALHEATLEKLLIGIRSWTFCYDEEGKDPIPCDRAHVALLDERDADFILEQLTEHWESWGKVGGDLDVRAFREGAPLGDAGTRNGQSGSGGPVADAPLPEGVSLGRLDVPRDTSRAD